MNDSQRLHVWNESCCYLYPSFHLFFLISQSSLFMKHYSSALDCSPEGMPLNLRNLNLFCTKGSRFDRFRQKGIWHFNPPSAPFLGANDYKLPTHVYHTLSDINKEQGDVARLSASLFSSACSRETNCCGALALQ